MAIAIDHVSLHAQLARANLIAEVETWGMREAAPIVISTLNSIIDVVENDAGCAGAYESERRHPRIHSPSSGGKAGRSLAGRVFPVVEQPVVELVETP